MNMDHWWSSNDRGNRCTWGRICSSATVSCINPIWSGLELNPALRDKIPATNCLRNDNGSCFCNTHFCIILQHNARCPKWPRSWIFSEQNFVFHPLPFLMPAMWTFCLFLLDVITLWEHNLKDVGC